MVSVAAPTTVPLDRTTPRQPPRSRAARRGLPVVPAVVLLLLFMAGPIVYSVYLAFTNRALRGEGADTTSFVGLENFTTALTASEFWNSVMLTLVFTVLSAIVGQNILGMVLALLMRHSNRVVTSLTGAVVVGAWILPEVVAAYLWYTFLGEGGSLNAILGLVGANQDWLFSMPILAVSLANIWRGTAFTMLMYSAALSSVPPDVTEAAEIDGAGPVRRFFSVIVPIIRRTIFTNLMLITLQTLSVFGLIFIMTAGGPGTASQTLPLYMYEQAFSYGLLGYGTAVALLLLLIGALASIAYLRLLPREETS